MKPRSNHDCLHPLSNSPTPVRLAAVAVAVCLFFALTNCPSLLAVETNKKNFGDSRLFAKLSVPMTSIVDGRSFRDGVTRISDSVEVNVWIDRHVDPSQIIQSGHLGPTAYEGLKRLASDHGCVVMPIRSVVIIGREDWVDLVVADLLKLPTQDRGKSIDVSWPRLTTPSQALDAVKTAGNISNRFDEPLAHDLWPSVAWKEIDPTVALTLVRMQCAARDPLVPLSKTSLARQKRIAADRQLTEAATKLKRSDPLSAMFSLTTQTRAANVLKQLCDAANLGCVIDPDAAANCEQIVSIKERDVSLRELIATIANKAGVVARWEASQVTFKKAVSPE